MSETNDNLVERDAKLFEAGDYPDKGVVVRESDLDAMVQNFEPVDIVVEHRDASPKLGILQRIWRSGKELLGRVGLKPEVDAMVQNFDTKKVSMKISPEKDKVLHVGLVKHPRVKSAQIFSDPSEAAIEFEFGETPQTVQEESPMATTAEKETPTSTPATQPPVDFSAELSAVKAQLDAAKAETESLRKQSNALQFSLDHKTNLEFAQKLSQDGKLPPAIVAEAANLLSMLPNEPIQFNGESVSISARFRTFLEQLPVTLNTKPLDGTITPQSTEFSNDQLAHIQRMFPNLTAEQIAAHAGGGK